MISNPYIVILFLISLEMLILALGAHPRMKKFFSIVPTPFWMYTVPMLASTVGLISPTSPLYSRITNQLLPASLVLLMLSSPLALVLKVGRPALLMMAAGSVGMMIGAPIAFGAVRGIVGNEFWSGFGALSGSWTGGSANMIAVKEALGTPDNVFLPMVIVDSIVPYVWMAFLVMCAGRQEVFDRWNGIRFIPPAHPVATVVGENRPVPLWHSGCVLVIAALGSVLARTVAVRVPAVPGVVTTTAWVIIIASVLGMVLSMTPVRRLERTSARIGYWLLYFVLLSMGAKANMVRLDTTVVLIGAGFLMVSVHAVVLLLAGRITRMPLSLMATASQANIGGVASAPVVAEVYRHGYASVGLLLAVVGNVCGTYVGILTGQVCRFIANF